MVCQQSVQSQWVYNGAITRASTECGVSAECPVTVGLHQGSALFVVVIDVISNIARKEELLELLYADDLVILAETEEELPRSLVEWQETVREEGTQSKCKENRKSCCVHEKLE